MLYRFIFSNRIFVRLSRHVALLVFSAVYLYLCSPYPDDFSEYFQMLSLLLAMLPVNVFSTYVTLSVLILSYLLRKEYKTFILVKGLHTVLYPIHDLKIESGETMFTVKMRIELSSVNRGDSVTNTIEPTNQSILYAHT
jgi:hypothetical protein